MPMPVDLPPGILHRTQRHPGHPPGAEPGVAQVTAPAGLDGSIRAVAAFA